MNILPSLWPGEVATYDGPTRICTVRIPGITDGSSELPQAVLMPPIGDRAQGDHPTELRILPGDLVWLMFEGGDPRFPIIVGARTARVGNPVDWRRWRHANIEMTADGQFIINAGEMTINAGLLKINAPVEIVGDKLTHNGKNVGDTHTHGGIVPGGSSTAPPN